MMNALYIVWSDSNELGIPIIDEQHRGIVSTINSLHHSIKTKNGAQDLEPILIMLRQYSTIHFRTEQDLMKEANYPGLEEHLQSHRELFETTTDFSSQLGRGANPVEVLRFLKEWWLGHINAKDRQYVPFLRELVGKED